MHLFLIDAIGPFFRDYQRQRINWSKIPFDNLETDGRFDIGRFNRIADDFAEFCKKAAAAGFTAISLDDLAHMVNDQAYPSDLRRKLDSYHDAYTRLFATAAACGLTVYATTDVMYEPSDANLRGKPMQFTDAINRLHDACDALFRERPAVAGVILRIGECDAADVRSDFKSRLILRTPRRARDMLNRLLPTFEHHGKSLIFRTWTVGAHAIGDLIWNRHTFDRVFKGIDSSRLIISMKFGESDFFRYLPLNPLFFRGAQAKLIEMQARREYEGFGEYPSFAGWDYAAYLKQLEAAPHVIGIWVWCQTGGWSGFRRRTFLDPSGIWSEINAVTTLRLARDRQSVVDTLHNYAVTQFGPGTGEDFVKLLLLSHVVIRQGLYIEEFARSRRYFRRLRVPPILHVFWDRILINHPMRKLLRCWINDHETACRQAYAALEHIRSMRSLAATVGLPVDDLDFQYDTFEILVAARDYYFGPFDPAIVQRIDALVTSYHQRYAHRPRYTVCADFSEFAIRRRTLRRVMMVLTRPRRGYRITDRVILIRLLSVLAPLIVVLARRTVAGKLADDAMGIETICE